jgi:hypothetical protein
MGPGIRDHQRVHFLLTSLRPWTSALPRRRQLRPSSPEPLSRPTSRSGQASPCPRPWERRICTKAPTGDYDRQAGRRPGPVCQRGPRTGTSDKNEPRGQSIVHGQPPPPRGYNPLYCGSRGDYSICPSLQSDGVQRQRVCLGHDGVTGRGARDGV